MTWSELAGRDVVAVEDEFPILSERENKAYSNCYSLTPTILSLMVEKNKLDIYVFGFRQNSGPPEHDDSRQEQSLLFFSLIVKMFISNRQTNNTLLISTPRTLQSTVYRIRQTCRSYFARHICFHRPKFGIQLSIIFQPRLEISYELCLFEFQIVRIAKIIR